MLLSKSKHGGCILCYRVKVYRKVSRTENAYNYQKMSKYISLIKEYNDIFSITSEGWNLKSVAFSFSQ